MILAFQASAQEQLSLKQQADRLYERYEYFKSLNLYLKLANRNHPSTPILERVADCYRNINRFQEAEAWYARAVTDTGASKLSHYYYAEALLYSQKTDQAKQQYQIYFSKVNEPAMKALKLANCDSAAVWVKQNSGYKVTSLPNINTPFSEWGLVDDTEGGMIYTSNRTMDNGMLDNRTGNGWFWLFAADKNGENSKPVYFANGIDGLALYNYHIGPIALNTGGDTAYITFTTDVEKKSIALDKPTGKRPQRLYTRRLELYVAVKNHDQWVVISKFPYSDFNKYSLGHAALSKNGIVIYFTSDMPGSIGKTDIWYCEKLKDNSWSRPVNCGPSINTKEEEAFPEIGGDGMLYYSSKGLPGMGGYDIYSAKGEKANWSAPLNLKFPVNTTADDFCLVTKDGITGYLSSNRQGGQGDDDIYQFTYVKPPIKYPAVATNPKPGIAAKPNPATSPNPAKSREIYAVNNIYYDLDKSNIRPDAAIELEKLIALLKQHPNLRLSLSSHTDSRASGEYNQALSQRRSASAIAYLTKHGISVFRITYANFGETHLVNECADGVNCTPEQHQLNRRTEFRLIEE
jgi:outer membrane protein OmpA-like peptidoglycan-associated protein